MSERYIKVFSTEEKLHTENAPLLILAGALLKDTENGKMIAQLKFQNISGKGLSYVKVAITQLDSLKNPLGEPVTFEYLDLSVGDREEFGSKKALPLPNASTRAFRVGVSHVGFADGTVWATEDIDWQTAKQDSAVMKVLEAENLYKKAISLSKSVNRDDIIKAKAILGSIAGEKDVEAEIGLCDQKLAMVEEMEEKKAAVSKKRKKIWKILALVAGILVVLGLALYLVVIPLVAYSTGNYERYIHSLWHSGDTFEVPDGVERIEDRAFYECRSLTSITLPDGVTEIGESAFVACYNLTELQIPDSVTRIGDNALIDCYSLTSITIPDSVTDLGEGVFCFGSLETVHIGDGIKELKYQVFGRNYYLTTVYIGSNVKYIDKYAFEYCERITSIYYNGTIEQWNSIEKYDWDVDFVSNNYTVYCTDGTITLG